MRFFFYGLYSKCEQISMDSGFMFREKSTEPVPVLLQLPVRIQWRLIFANVTRCSRLRLYIVCFLFQIYNCVLLFDGFNGCSLAISKGMSNIYLKVTIEKKWCSESFDFLCSKNLSPGQFLGSCNSRRYHWIWKLLVTT